MVVAQLATRLLRILEIRCSKLSIGIVVTLVSVICLENKEVEACIGLLKKIMVVFSIQIILVIEPKS